MTLLESTYTQLRALQLVSCAEAFSTDYLAKSKNWYAYQKHTGRNFSVDAAVQCLRSIRVQMRVAALSTAQRQLLVRLEQELLAHLNSQHCVADVC